MSTDTVIRQTLSTSAITQAEKDARLRRGLAQLLGRPAEPTWDKNAAFIGMDSGNPDEHRTTGQRAWSEVAGEWCYPDHPCSTCEPPVDKTALRRLLDPKEVTWP